MFSGLSQIYFKFQLRFLGLTSPNAPKIRDVLGTILLSVLSGHTRYSHITTVRTDKVNAPLLGMRKIVSEDSVRRTLIKILEAEGTPRIIEKVRFYLRQRWLNSEDFSEAMRVIASFFF